MKKKKTGNFGLLVSCGSRATTAKKCTKGVMHVQSCCFAVINLLPFSRSWARAIIVN